MSEPTSFWTKINHSVTSKQAKLQNLRYALRVKIGVPHLALELDDISIGITRSYGRLALPERLAIEGEEDGERHEPTYG